MQQFGTKNPGGVMRYINIKYNGITETIDQFQTKTKEDRKELRRCFKEYLISYSGQIWISQRCTKEWRKPND